MSIDEAVQKMTVLQIYTERSGYKTTHIQRLILREFSPEEQEIIIDLVVAKFPPMGALGGAL